MVYHNEIKKENIKAGEMLFSSDEQTIEGQQSRGRGPLLYMSQQ
jgi:hypothetical protein